MNYIPSPPRNRAPAPAGGLSTSRSWSSLAPPSAPLDLPAAPARRSPGRYRGSPSVNRSTAASRSGSSKKSTRGPGSGKKKSSANGAFASSSRNAVAGRSSYLPPEVAAFYSRSHHQDGGKLSRRTPPAPARSVQVKLTASAKARMQQRWFAQTTTTSSSGTKEAPTRPRFNDSARVVTGWDEQETREPYASPGASNPFSTLLDEWQLGGGSPGGVSGPSTSRGAYSSTFDDQAMRGSPAGLGQRDVADGGDGGEFDNWSDEARFFGLKVLAELRRRTITPSLLLEWGDTRKNGALTPAEFAAAVNAHGSSLNPREARLLFNNLDRTKVGRVSFEDLRELYILDQGALANFDETLGGGGGGRGRGEGGSSGSRHPGDYGSPSAAALGNGIDDGDARRMISWRHAEELKREALAQLAIEAQSEMRAALQRCVAHAKHENDAAIEEVHNAKVQWEQSFAETANSEMQRMQEAHAAALRESKAAASAARSEYTSFAQALSSQLHEIEEQSKLAKLQSTEHAATAAMLPEMRVRMQRLLIELKQSESMRDQQALQLNRAVQMLEAAGYDPSVLDVAQMPDCSSAAATAAAAAAASASASAAAARAPAASASTLDQLEAKTAALQQFVQDTAVERDAIIASMQEQ